MSIMDHIGAILAQQHPHPHPHPDDALDLEAVIEMEDGFSKLKILLSRIAKAVSQLTCKRSLADGKYGVNRFHGVISFQNNLFIVQYVNETSMGFETLVRVYDYTYHKDDQLFVTKFKNPQTFTDSIQEKDDIFRFNDMIRWRWEIKNVCKCCNTVQDHLVNLEELATEVDRMTARSRTTAVTNT